MLGDWCLNEWPKWIFYDVTRKVEWPHKKEKVFPIPCPHSAIKPTKNGSSDTNHRKGFSCWYPWREVDFWTADYYTCKRNGSVGGKETESKGIWAKKKQTERIIDSGHIDLYDKGLKITARSMTKWLHMNLKSQIMNPSNPTPLFLGGEEEKEFNTD